MYFFLTFSVFYSRKTLQLHDFVFFFNDVSADVCEDDESSERKSAFSL